MTTRLAKRALIIILASIVAAWIFFMAAVYTDLFLRSVYEDGVYVGEEPAIRASTYLFVAAVAVVSVATLIAQRLAIRARIAARDEEALPRATHRFATLAIVITLAFATFFGVTVFLQSFPGRLDETGIGERFFTTYLPIILYTAILVTVLLVGFVFRKDKLTKSSRDAHSSTPTSHESDDAGTDSRALGGAYAVPIVAAAIALIFGLLVRDITQTALDLWIWVIIHVIIGTGIILGTIFAARAMGHHDDPTSSRARITRSSGIFNFTLSVVFIAVVLGMGFGTGASSVESLRISPQLYVEVYPGQSDALEDVTVSVNGWDLSPDTPVTVILDETGEELISGEVGSFREFYGQEEIPDTLEPGEYRVSAEGTGVDGKALSSSLGFTVTEDGRVEMKSLTGPQWRDEDPTVIAADWSWGVREMLPAITMLLIGLITAYITITRRNPQAPASVDTA